MKPINKIQADFDRIALLSEQFGWNHNTHYHGFLLRHLPPSIGQVLDVGCGTGDFSRCLATRSTQVLGLDLSPEMIRVARQRSVQFPNIDYKVADVLTWDFPESRFDCIVSIATLHHLPMEATLVAMQKALKPGGTLLILDLYQAESLPDILTSLVAIPVNFALRIANGKQSKEPQELKQAWAEHGKHEVYPTLSEVRQMCANMLHGARVKRHLLWRYSIVWKKSGSSL